jgi:glyoxylase-like metal-dependent hydrolase (beta-lactamase superfamily II)
MATKNDLPAARPLALKQISDHVWILPHNPQKHKVQGTVGIVSDGRQTILIDSGNSPQLARDIQAALKATAVPPVRALIYTHHHWDHAFAAYVHDVPTIGHVRTRAYLEAFQKQEIDERYLLHREGHNPRFSHDFLPQDWAALRFIPPQTTFTTEYTLPLDGVTLQLQHVGGRHADDSIVITIVEDGVMFLGDCYYPPPVVEAAGDTVLSYEMLADLLDERVEWYIDAHNAPFRRKHIERILRSQQLIARLHDQKQQM